VRQVLRWTTAEAAPQCDEVMRLQGLPRGAEPSPRVALLYDRAMEVFHATAQPRAVMSVISAPAFAGVYRGAGRNAPAGPLELILPGAEHLALFAATLGDAVTARVRSMFDRSEPAMGSMLDAIASASADRLASLLAPAMRTLVGAAPDAAVLGYSPGYCGWHVTGQQALFAHLAPGEIDITLNASCLMVPLKSVSGVLVAGPSDIHRFVPDFPFCSECADKPCRPRIASLAQG
jgi:hypothetical protein